MKTILGKLCFREAVYGFDTIVTYPYSSLSTNMLCTAREREISDCLSDASLANIHTYTPLASRLVMNHMSSNL